jgi:hypothetical protein
VVIFEGVLILRFFVKLLRKLKKAKLKILRFITLVLLPINNSQATVDEK